MDAQEIAERMVLPDPSPMCVYFATSMLGSAGPSGGLGSIREDGPAPDSNTLFRIGSLTKSFTAAAVLHARDSGLLELDHPIDAFVPEVATLRLPSNDSPKITLRHLLSMSSGFAKDDQWATRMIDIRASSLLFHLKRGIRFASAPGEKYEYSNLGYAVAALALERAAGKPARDYIQQTILDPLGMSSTKWELTSAEWEHAATGYYNSGGRWAQEASSQGDGALGPSVGLWSTAVDLCRWMEFWYEVWPPGDLLGSVLSPASRREAQCVHRDVPTSKQLGAHRHWLGYGLGLRMSYSTDLGKIVDHSGGVPGFGCNMAWLPDESIAVVALTNERFASMHHTTESILRELRATRSGRTVSRPSESLIRAANELLLLLNDWDDHKANQILADNVFLDHEISTLNAQAATLLERYGKLRLKSITPRTFADGLAHVEGNRGAFTIRIRLVPTLDLKIARYIVDSTA